LTETDGGTQVGVGQTAIAELAGAEEADAPAGRTYRVT
jgi:hypothetical protein